MPSPALLLDLYDTIVSCDVTRRADVLPGIAGVDRPRWEDAARPVAPLVTEGSLTMAEAFLRVLLACDRSPEGDLVGRLVEADRRLVISETRLYDDVVPFLERIR